MTHSLRTRLFVAILATILVAVGVTLAIGVVRTRDALRDSIVEQLSREVALLERALRAAPPGGPEGRVPLEPPPPARFERPRDVPGPARPRFLPVSQAARLLPGDAVERLRAGRPADGRARLDGRDELFAARPTGGLVVVLSRPASLGGTDFSPYLSGLLLASGIGALLAAAAAALLSRRLSAPLRRVAEASRALAQGRRPEPLPPEDTSELSGLVDAFNDMSTQLERAREAERSVLLSVSHELRTPLHAIRGYAEGLEDGAVAPRDATAVITAEARRLERLVQDLLALARLEQGVLEVRREPLDLVEIAQEARRRLALEADRRGVELAVDAAAPSPAVGDRDRAVQVVSNLVENALRVTPAGGRVAVEVDGARVRVADSGPGIAAEDLPHAFDRFHLRRRDGAAGAHESGVGIGLAIVRELTEAMGGRVSVASRPGQGATFTLELPAA